MTREQELAVVRTAYAKQIMAVFGESEPRIEAAYAHVKREDFVGPGPWRIVRGFGRYVATPSDDPVYLYTDDLIGLVPARGLNNGEPSFHAHLLSQAQPREGDHVVHIGAGTGYYTAIMAHLVGKQGTVTAIEFDPELASRAKANLAPLKHVTVIEGDGALVPLRAADVIYVNAGGTQPASTWLDGLADGGRLILPLTTAKGFSFANSAEAAAVQGAVYLITRRSNDFIARWISPVAIFPCAGNRDEEAERALANALANGRWHEVTRLHRSEDIPDDRCWLKGKGWCLAYS